MGDCSHDWGVDIMGCCKGCGEFVPEDARPVPDRRGIAADVQLPLEDAD